MRTAWCFVVAAFICSAFRVDRKASALACHDVVGAAASAVSRVWEMEGFLGDERRARLPPGLGVLEEVKKDEEGAEEA
eukprot:224999-Pelagomonas_calceolata.AAC.3